MTLTQLPYDQLKVGIEHIRKRYFTHEWPEGPESLKVAESPETLEKKFRNAGWEGMYLAYRYEGEVFNLRKPAGKDDEGNQLEDHIRGRATDSEPTYTEIIAHNERSRYEHKSDHINEVGFSWYDREGIARLITEMEDTTEP